MSSQRYRLNTPAVVRETIDREATILNLETGCYFSVSGSGPEVLDLLDICGDPEVVSAAIAAATAAPIDDVRSAVRSLVASLVTDGVLVADDTAIGAVAPTSRLTVFEPPVLSRFEDLKDLLLADPIHDVGESGWPTQAKAPGPAAGVRTGHS